MRPLKTTAFASSIGLLLLLSLGLASSSLIQLLEPEQGALLAEQPVFRFTTSVNASNCSLYINDTVAATVANVLGNSEYNLSPQLAQGYHNWYIECISNQTISSGIRSFELDDTAPVITVEQQNSVYRVDSVNVSIEVSEEATCRMDLNNEQFDSMDKLMNSAGVARWFYLVDMGDGSYEYHIGCKDLAGNVAYATINFTIESPLEGSVRIDTNTDNEGHYFLPMGRKPLEFKISRRLEHAPTLYYQYEDGTKHDVALTGSGRSWHGYVIIEQDVNDKVAVFSASYENEPIEITGGLMFVVDSKEPPMPSTLQGLDKGENGVYLEWYYAGEQADYFNIYRSTTEKLTHLDLINQQEATQFTDHSAEPGHTYYYRVTAVDLAGNEGPFSPVLKLHHGEEGQQEPDPLVITKLNLSSKILEELRLDLINAKANLNGITELKTKAIVGQFELISQIDAKLAELDKQKLKQPHDAKGVNALAEEIAIFEKEAKATTVTGITFEGETEKRQTLSDGEIKTLIKGMLNLEEDQLSQYQDEVLALNSMIDVDLTAERYKFTMLDGSEQRITKIHKTLTYRGTDTVPKLKLVEFIPKQIAQSSQDLKINTLGYKVVKQDPIIEWEISELGFAQRELDYYVKTQFNLSELDKLASLYMTPVPESVQPTKATGFSVKDSTEGPKFSPQNIALSVLSLTIVSLLLYYFVLMKPGSRTDFSLVHLGSESDFNRLLRKGHTLIDNLNYKPAKQLYVYMTELLQTEVKVGGLGVAQKRGLQEFHAKLKLFRSIAKAQELLESKSYEELSALLTQLQPLMLNLTRKDSKLLNYLTHWYYHYVNIVDFKGKK